MKWLFPKETVYAAIQHKAPPLRTQRWCCDVLKKDPTKQIPLKHHVLGIRKEESRRRAKRPRIDKFYGQTAYKPIFYWPEWAVWEAIESWHLPYPPLYDEGFSRIGCVVCPFLLGAARSTAKRRELSMQRWPNIWKAYEHAVKRWWNTKRKEKPLFERRHATADDYWKDYLLGFEKGK